MFSYVLVLLKLWAIFIIAMFTSISMWSDRNHLSVEALPHKQISCHILLHERIRMVPVNSMRTHFIANLHDSSLPTPNCFRWPSLLRGCLSWRPMSTMHWSDWDHLSVWELYHRCVLWGSCKIYRWVDTFCNEVLISEKFLDFFFFLDP